MLRVDIAARVNWKLLRGIPLRRSDLEIEVEIGPRLFELSSVTVRWVWLLYQGRLLLAACRVLGAWDLGSVRGLPDNRFIPPRLVVQTRPNTSTLNLNRKLLPLIHLRLLYLPLKVLIVLA